MGAELKATWPELTARRLYSERPRRLLQNRDALLSHVQLGVSIVASVLVLLGLAQWRDGTITMPYRQLAVIMALLMLVIYQWRGIYRRFNGFWRGAMRIGRAWLAIVCSLLLFAFLTHSGENYSRLVIGSWMFLAYFVQLAGYGCSIRLAARHQRHPIRVAVVGSHWLAGQLVSNLRANTWMPDQVVGVIDNNQGELDAWNQSEVPFLGATDNLQRLVREHRISRVYIALPISESECVEKIYAEVAELGADVIWVPDIFSMPLLNHSVRELNGLPLIALSESPLMLETQAMYKSMMDKSIAIAMILMLSPLLLVVAIAVKATSPGPVIFRQKRHGWDGRIIEIYKFRSMYHKKVVAGVEQAQRNDPRVTVVGRFIRRTSIDELPQLFNVLEGSMSLVGPRPHATEHNEFYSSRIRSYMLRHRIKPGLTGLAQVRGLRGETDTLDKMRRRVETDIEYINQWSLWLDIKILLMTPLTLLSRNAY